MDIPGVEYRRSLGLPDSPLNRNSAQGKAAQIERDIALELFDPTLERYWPKAEALPERLSTVELWEQFMQAQQAQGTSGQAISTKYRPMLANFGALAVTSSPPTMPAPLWSC
ncbi:MAG: DUF3596 domain-containing protein [Leptolyngbyaceae cyanobacterium SM2_5_2]|nr:DUF3596 domain-containing protein [Leptolyngbyaceae cyanobacterium SM2_5_2]